MDIWKWLTRRVFHLPAGHNSVSEIIGESNWNAIRTTVTGLLQSAIGKELIGIENVAYVDVNKLVAAALGVFKGTDNEFKSAVQSSIMASVRSSLNKNADQLQTTIISDLSKVIGLQ